MKIEISEDEMVVMILASAACLALFLLFKGCQLERNIQIHKLTNTVNRLER